MSTDQDWIRSDGKGGVRIGDADPITAPELDAFVSLLYRVAGRTSPPAITPADDPETSRAGAYQTGGDDV